MTNLSRPSGGMSTITTPEGFLGWDGLIMGTVEVLK